MIQAEATDKRTLKTEQIEADLAVIGGGLAGVCAAITAARQGLSVTLIQDRPVLGGNASSEVRLWVLGATSHMGNNNRWARESGVIGELLVENLYRNPEGNPLIFDTVLLEKVVEEPNITLLLNTAVYDLSKSDADTIESVTAFCSQNSTRYHVSAPLFCDASGDGVVGFMAGGAFRMGGEGRDEFGEAYAPEKPHNELLGDSMYFYTKDTGKPVSFTPPSFALDDIKKIPRWRSFNAQEQGCQLWWIEFGGLMDTIHESEKIKWELWRVIYGVWNHIKNSGQFPEAENLTLEWVGHIPGKRESRRFEGDYMLRQQDIVEQRRHPDAVAYGGWAIDHHPAEGVYTDKSPCTQWHSKGVYQIPYRCLYSRNITNLFLAGRIISSSHIAFGSTRVMATCAHTAQAVGQAAVLCRQDGLVPRDLAEPQRIGELQRSLLRIGQHIPMLAMNDPQDLAAKATVTVSSTHPLKSLPRTETTQDLATATAMLLPVRPGRVPAFTFWAHADEPAEFEVELRGCSRPGTFTPDELLATCTATIPPPADRMVELSTVKHSAAVAQQDGTQVLTRTKEKPQYLGVAPHAIELDFNTTIDRERYLMVCFPGQEGVSLVLSDQRMTGVLALSQKGMRAVSKSNTQTPPEGCGIDSFPFWLPARRPDGKNLAMRAEPALEPFDARSLTTGPDRPEDTPNAWVAEPDDANPWAELAWDTPQTFRRVRVSFDTDYDHAMESALMHHPERVSPFCVPSARLVNDAGQTLATLRDNHQSHWEVRFDAPVTTSRLRLEVDHPDTGCPAAVFRVRVFA